MMSAIGVCPVTASGMPVACFLEQQILWAGSDHICQQNPTKYPSSLCLCCSDTEIEGGGKYAKYDYDLPS